MGRRWGKTLGSAMEILKNANDNPYSFNMWVAPVFGQAKIPWRLLAGIPKEKIIRRTMTQMEIELFNHSIIKFGSATHPENLRGFGIDFLICDEAAFLPREIWEEVLRPALSDRQGRAIFISTPKGKNWFYELFLRGQDPAFPEFESFTMPTADNPYVTAGDIEEARLTLPEDVFVQEFLAQFLDDGAGVFRHLSGIYKGTTLRPPQPGFVYSMGVDIAKYVDFTVISVLDQRGELAYIDRFNKYELTYQMDKVADIAQKYHNAQVVVDRTGMGEMPYETLQRKCKRVLGVNFDHATKTALIENLVVMIEKQAIKIPSCTETKFLYNEMDVFGYTILPNSRQIKYSAPGGYHDDGVISLSLAAWGLRRPVYTRGSTHNARTGKSR
jgi:hypothetical protein